MLYEVITLRKGKSEKQNTLKDLTNSLRTVYSGVGRGAAIALGLDGYDAMKVHGCELTLAQRNNFV